MSNLSKLLAKGSASVRQGDVTAAREAFEKAVHDHAHRSESWINLSAVHGMEGNYAEALRCARKAVELAPSSLQGWVNLGNAAQSCDDPAQAAEAFRRALALPGCPPEITLSLAQTLVQLDRWPEAENLLRAHLTHKPGDREATLMLVKNLAIRKQPEAAMIMEDYFRRNQNDKRARFQLGSVYFELDRMDDALHVCEQAEQEFPDDPEVLILKGALLTFDGRYHAARDAYEKLARIQPGDPFPLIKLAHVCRQTGDGGASIAYARAVLKTDPRNAEALVALSVTLTNSDPGEARQMMERAREIAPNDPAVISLQGQLLELEGDKQGAWECVRPLLETDPPQAAAATVAARVAPDIGRMEETVRLVEQVVSRPGLSTTEQRMLRFALVKLCDKAKQYDRAFGHAVIANKLKNVRHDDKGNERELNRLKAVYSAAAIGSLPYSSIRSELPLFIVGMPRSGTTLLEQILSCHSRVHARGETTDVKTLKEGIPYYPDGVRSLTQEKLDAMAGEYVRRLRDMAPSATRVSDKMPGNYWYLGLISQIFPGTRILHCRRDPRDVCISNYFTEFAMGHTNTYDLESMALTYKGYRELMEHWKAVLPIPIMDVPYEELVEEPRAWVEKILDFCGLEWEEACLNFHQSKRLTVTASYDQVRRPLYKSSKARWKNYAKYLEPVNRILGLKDEA